MARYTIEVDDESRTARGLAAAVAAHNATIENEEEHLDAQGYIDMIFPAWATSWANNLTDDAEARRQRYLESLPGDERAKIEALTADPDAAVAAVKEREARVAEEAAKAEEKV